MALLNDLPGRSAAEPASGRFFSLSNLPAAALSRLEGWFGSALPAVLYGLRLWAAVCLALYLAFWLELQNPSWAGTTAAIVCQPALGASLRKGWFRLIGTVIGAIAALVLSALFPQARAGFLLGLAFWGGLCALGATLLRNFAAYAAALAGYTAAVIAGDELGAVGGTNGDAFNLAVARSTEIGLGIVCAGFVLATTDLGGARRRLAALLAGLSSETAAGLIRALWVKGPTQGESATERRQVMVRVAGLDTVIDQASGEIATLPFRPRALQSAADGLFNALFAWRSVALHLEFLPEAAADAALVRDCLPEGLATPEAAGDPSQWLVRPQVTRAALRAAARRLVAVPAQTPSLRLLCDRTAEGLLGLSRAITGVMVLGDPWIAQSGRNIARLRPPDVLPALINAVRAFLTIGAAALIWVWLAWPSGTTFIVFATVAITLFAPQEDAAYASAKTYTVGAVFAVMCAAVVGFALLPRQQGFLAFCVTLGLVLVPAGALSAQPWRQSIFAAIAANFIPLLGPSNPMTYNVETFYNTAIALLGGIAFAMLAMRLMPPMPPTMRARRLLGLTLRDLRRLTHARLPRSSERWEGRVYGRLAAIPDSVELVQAARLGSALSVGVAIIRLRRIAQRFSLDAELAPALAAIAAGDNAATMRGLHRFDQALAVIPGTQAGARVRLRARGTIRSMADALTRHAPYFFGKV